MNKTTHGKKIKERDYQIFRQIEDLELQIATEIGSDYLDAEERTKYGGESLDRAKTFRAALKVAASDGINTKSVDAIYRKIETLRESIVVQYQGFARARAVKFIENHGSASSFDIDDLSQIACLGMMKAIVRFQTSSGSMFTTYAKWWINATFQREIANGDGLTTNQNIQQHRLNIRNHSNLLREELGRKPTYEEIARSIGNISAEHVERLSMTSRRLVSMDAPISSDDERTVADFVFDEGAPTDESITNDVTLKACVQLMSELTEQERQILTLRYGIDDGIEHSLYEIGRLIGRSRERVRQIEMRAIRKLSEKVEARRREQKRVNPEGWEDGKILVVKLGTPERIKTIRIDPSWLITETQEKKKAEPNKREPLSRSPVSVQREVPSPIKKKPAKALMKKRTASPSPASPPLGPPEIQEMEIEIEAESDEEKRGKDLIDLAVDIVLLHPHGISAAAVARRLQADEVRTRNALKKANIQDRIDHRGSGRGSRYFPPGLKPRFGPTIIPQDAPKVTAAAQTPIVPSAPSPVAKPLPQVASPLPADPPAPVPQTPPRAVAPPPRQPVQPPRAQEKQKAPEVVKALDRILNAAEYQIEQAKAELSDTEVALIRAQLTSLRLTLRFIRERR